MTKQWRGCTCEPDTQTTVVVPETLEERKTTPGCPVHDYRASDEDGKVYEYTCLIIHQDGNGTEECLSATGTSHAFTEAEAEFGKCVAVKRGEYLHDL